MPSPGPSAGRGPTQSGRAARPSALAAGTARLAPAPLRRVVHTWSLSLLLSVAFSPPPSAACTYPTGGEEGLTPSSPRQQLLSTEGKPWPGPPPPKYIALSPGSIFLWTRLAPTVGSPGPHGDTAHTKQTLGTCVPTIAKEPGVKCHARHPHPGTWRCWVLLQGSAAWPDPAASSRDDVNPGTPQPAWHRAGHGV